MKEGMESFPRPERRWVTLDQLLEIVPLKRSRVYYLVHTNQIPHLKVGRSLLFDVDKIEAWLSSLEVQVDG